MSLFKRIYQQIVKRLQKIISGEKIIKNNMPESTLGLHQELIVLIGNKLPIKSLIQLAQVNKETYTVLSQVPYKIKDMPEIYKLRTLGLPHYDLLLFNRKRENL